MYQQLKSHNTKSLSKVTMPIFVLILLAFLFTGCEKPIEDCDLPIEVDFKAVDDAASTADPLEYIITPNEDSRDGGIWCNQGLNLNSAFDLNFEFYLGTDPNGADGMAFVLQRHTTSSVSAGGNLGYGLIDPSLAVQFDTYQNPSQDDPADNHVGLMRDGEGSHANCGPGQNCLTEPVVVSNLEDGAYHPVNFNWNPDANLFTVTLDGVEVISYNGDIRDFFACSDVYFGITGSTGAAKNEHKVKVGELDFEEVHVVTLNSSDNGTIVLEVTGGNATYNYSWEGPESGLVEGFGGENIIIDGLAPGEYMVEVEDGCGISTCAVPVTVN